MSQKRHAHGIMNRSLFRIKKPNWGSWINRGIRTISGIIEQNKIIPFEQLRRKFNQAQNEIFRYLQFKKLDRKKPLC